MSLSGMFNQVITVYNKTSYDRYGSPVVGSGVSENCRFEKVTKLVMLPTNEVKRIEAIVYTRPDLTININDRVDFGTDKYQVFGKTEPVDGNGNINHLKIELVKWQVTST